MMKLQTLGMWALGGTLTLAVTGCGNGSASSAGTLTVAGDVPIVYAKRVNTVNLNPTSGAPSVPGGDLIIREKASSSAVEHNITAQFTQGQGDASSPTVSYDGKKIAFAMRCPSSSPAQVNGQPACTGRWNIWEYDMTTGGLTGGTFRRITSGGDDVEPAYLPAGRGFVFTSNRQAKSSINQDGMGHSYRAQDEYERQGVFNLHTSDAQGGNITQISFNQSHDRNPTVRPNGDIMYARWDHVGGRNHFKVFTVKPDGTNLFVLYGAHSSGNSFLIPRDMDPAGKYAGKITTSLMPLSRTHEGGALMFIDVANFSEESTPANANVTAAVGAQHQATAQQLSIGGGISEFGRINSPYPLWDGTDRVLVSYAPCEVSNNGVVVSCATLSAADIARLGMDRLTADIKADPLQENVPPSYAVYMFDPAQQTFLIVAAPPPGFMYEHPVAIQPRTEPNAALPTNVDATLAAQGLGVLNVRSVYDTDGLGRMGNGVLTAADLPAGCATGIAQTAPTDPLDTRASVADIAHIKDPAHPAYGCAPARFIRAIRAIAPGVGMSGARGALGNTDFEMQQILGYAPIEPDGSFKLTVPADTPIGLVVVDAKGRGLQTHTNWIQVRPGELRTCDGCHSPRRGAALNSGTVLNTVPAGIVPMFAAAHKSGETMADTRTRLNPAALKLGADPVYADVWADTTQPGVTGRASFALLYTGNANPADDMTTPPPTNGLINYPDHIQPLWSVDRGANTCTGCHNDPAKLDLTGTMAGTGRVDSYEKLTLGDPLFDPVTGLPVIVIEEGVPMIQRGPALVNTAASEGEALGMARKSRLIEIVFGESLSSSANDKTVHPNPPATAPNHATMLSAAEKRVVTEWIDTGSKYYNDPFNANNGMVQVTGLSEDTFNTTIEPIITKTCAAYCHQAFGSSASGVPALGTSFRNNNFVLTGDSEGDYGVTLSMISNACSPASNFLLSKPSSVPHPTGAQGQTTAVLPVGSADYNTILAWIATGC